MRGHALAAGFDRVEIVPRAIHGGPREIVHRRIDDHEGRAIAAALGADHAGQQHARIARDHAARLEHQAHVPILGHPRDHGAIFGRGGEFLARLVGHTQPAAEIGMGDGAAARAQFSDQRPDLAEGGLERLERRQLAADMDRHAAHIEAVFFGQPGIDFRRSVERDAELVLALAGRDFLMRARIDIGIDAQGAGGALAVPRGDGSQLVALFLALDVELADARFEPLQQFGMGLADAREDDVLGLHPCGQCAGQFAARHHVGAIAFIGEYLEHREVGIGFHCEGDMRVLERAQRLAEHARMPFQRGTRIDIDRRPDLFGNVWQWHALGMQYAVSQLKMIHGHRLCPKPRCMSSKACLRR